MSDESDSTGSAPRRGPLPRSKRSRRRPRQSPEGGGQDEAAAQPKSDAEAPVNEETVDIETREDTSEVVAAKTAPDLGEPKATPSETGELAERPTQLDTRPDAETRSDFLKRATISRATDAPEQQDGGPAAAKAYIGYVIDGRYHIESVLGRGGMGVVYRARHRVIDKLAAVKILLPTEDTDVVTRFVNEARTASAIGNAHIVDTFDFGQLPDGSTYFVMEYLEGETLAKLIKREGHIALDRAILLASQIAKGMHAAHEANIVHRDLKPENIFVIQREGKDFVKLLDFGIAKVANAQNKITRAGTIFGTPHYMSPEQAAGTEVDFRTDIYSLGVILYEMVAGHVPFEAENPMGLLTQHMYKDPTPLTELEEPPQQVPIGLDAIVLKCMAKKPEERFPTMAEFGRDLERLQAGAAPSAIAYLLTKMDADSHGALLQAAEAASRSHRPKRRRLWLYALIAAALASAGIVFAGRLRGPSEPSPALPGPVSGREDLEPRKLHAPDASTTDEGDSYPVHVVVLPIDAEVFRGGESLGTAPVTVAVPKGQTISVEVKREGFYAQLVELDDTQPVKIVRLTAIPGVEVSIPVPDMEAIERFRRQYLDAGRRKLLTLTADAGKPKRAPKQKPSVAPKEPAAVSPAETPPAPSAEPSKPAPPPPSPPAGSSELGQ